MSAIEIFYYKSVDNLMNLIDNKPNSYYRLIYHII